MPRPTTVGLWLFALFCSVQSAPQRLPISPTNSTSDREYYVSTADSPFKGPIECDSTKDCYVRCNGIESCKETKIQCDSPTCDIFCSAESCANTEITINHLTPQTGNKTVSAKISCVGHNACYEIVIVADKNDADTEPELVLESTLIDDGEPSLVGASVTVADYRYVQIRNDDAGKTLKCDDDQCITNKFILSGISLLHISESFNDASNRPQEFSIIDSNHVNITCYGQEACKSDVFDVYHDADNPYGLKAYQNTSVMLQCEGAGACQHVYVHTSPGDELNMYCLIGDEVCKYAELFVSPRFDNSHITCNGLAGSGSCAELVITVPPNYQPLFLHAVFNNAEDKDALPDGGSIDGVTVKCDGVELCTEYTSFPLLMGDAVPDLVVKAEDANARNSSYFYGNHSYNYLFKKITCKAGEDCFVDCKKSYTCGSTFVDCAKGSKCNIRCEEPYQCDNLVVKAYGDEVNLFCGSALSCNEAKIWIPDAEDELHLSSSLLESLTDLTFVCENKEEGKYLVDSNSEYKCDNPKCCPVYEPEKPSTDGGSKSDNTTTIVVVVVGVIVLLLIIGSVVVWNNKRKEQPTYVQMGDPLVNN